MPDTADRRPPSAGRPRSGARRRPGSTAREEILDAAAELFARAGYAATSTRAIAEAVGIRQASLYYHFSTKEQVLAALLASTVRPSLEVAERLEGSGAPAETALAALVRYDVDVLARARWNVGLLYALPEVASEPFTGFRDDREQLRKAYRRLCATGPAAPSLAGDLVFGLVESVIALRRDVPQLPGPAELAEELTQTALRMLGWSTQQAREIARRSEALPA